MAIELTRTGPTAIFYVSEKLDAVTSIELENKLMGLARFVNLIVFDFKDLVYISSMGLRAILAAHKMMDEREGRLVCRNIPEETRKVFEMSGFIDTIVRDEKLAIIKRNRDYNTAKYALVGELEEDKAYSFEQEWALTKSFGVKSLDIDCSALAALSSEAADILIKIRERIVAEKGGFTLDNVTDKVREEIKESGHGKLLEPVGVEVITKNAEAAVIHYKYKKWEPKLIAVLDKNWLATHVGVKTVVIDFKEVGKIPPDGQKLLKKVK
ncbi:MAG: STAS domain-containing protein, partial [Spirochaetaceae bacterium]|nr:STAS domain-containing protein [Spirochaetaceae bacterium]